MRSIATAFLFAITLVPITGFSQGGKAEPVRVEFVRGSSSARLTGVLSNEQEMDHVFYAREGQRVTIRNNNTGLFDVRVFSSEADLESDFDSSRVFSFTVPESGDYLLFVRKKQVRKPQRARFNITLTIK